MISDWGNQIQTRKGFSSHAAGRPRGSTIVELLAVMCVVVVLFSLLVPAISRCREAARRTHCRNNVCQLIVALQHYEMAHRVLPPGCVNESSPVYNRLPGYHTGWLAQIAPLFDCSGIALHLNSTKSIYDSGNDRLRRFVPAVLKCPSVVPTEGVSSYAGCAGSSNVPLADDNDGLLYLNSSISHQQIEDGTSNTVLIGERVPGDTPNGKELGWLSGTSASIRHTGIPANRNNSWSGGNSGSVPSADLQIGGFNSPHNNNTITVGLADGAVRDISEAVSLNVWANLGHRSDGTYAWQF